MPDRFRTVLHIGSDAYTVQKSRFLSDVFPCEDESAALEAIGIVRRAHPQATHHCYAYVIGANAGIIRYSDDGEPSGTAGLPILGVLERKGLVNVCAVVTRYFGGILLGTGGLVRAYSHACALGVQKACVISKLPTQRMMLDIPYPLWDKIQFFLKGETDVITENVTYGTAVTLTLLVKQDAADSLIRSLTNRMNGALEPILSDPFLHCWEISEGQSE